MIVPVTVAAAMLLAGCADGGGGGTPSTQGRAASTQGRAAELGDVAPTEGPAVAAGPPRGPERLAYTAPTGRPGAPVDQKVGRAPGRLFDDAQAALRGAGLQITHLDERAGVIAAQYSGDPSRFVDCGTIVARAVEGGRERRLEAASERATFRRGQRRGFTQVDRDLVLSARVVLQMKADGAGATRLRSRATYVLTRTTSPQGAEPRVETVAFPSGGRRGSFVKGTVCQPTGSLERLALVSAGA